MIRTTLRNSVLTCLLLLIFFAAKAQQPNNIAKWIESTQTRSSVSAVSMYKLADNTRALPTVKEGRILQIDNNVLASLLVNHPAMIEIDLPVKGGPAVTLKLAKVQVTSDDFEVVVQGSERGFHYDNGVHYRGIVKGDNQSVAAMSFFNGEVSGFYSTSHGNFTIGKLTDQNDLYAVYNEAKEDRPEMKCGSEELEYHGNRDPEVADPRGVGCKVVKVYFVTDYKLYTDKGSNATNVTNYVNSFFNQVATLYQNENIDIQISTIYVYTTTDPYASLNSTSAVLNAFKSNTGSGFNGDLAHFLTTRNLGGGIAYVNVLCQKAYAFGVSAIYNTFNNVPSFSWTIECVTHELGHNLGSPHTQSCTWPGGAIDNCYTTEGGCAPGPAPTNGGTIMSYCHLTNYGINFNNGFGTLPGDLIRTKVTNAACLTQNGVVPSGLATSNITSSTATVTWVAVPNATEYTVQYKLNSSNTWITAGTTASTSYNLTGLTANSLYNWKVKTSCSSYSAAINFTTLASGSGCNAPSNLTTSNITFNSATLSWGAVSGATSYTVEYKVATSNIWISLGSVSTTSINLPGLLALTTYNWQVKANCSSFAPAVSFTTLQNSGNCAAPTGLTSSGITASTATVSWGVVSGATSYTVQFRVNGSNTWLDAGTTSTTSLNLSGLSGSTTYQWQVKANCSVYSSIATFTTQAPGSNCNAPSNLSASGITHNQATLSWGAVSGATSYTVQYKVSTSQTWITFGTTSQTSVSLTGLLALTSYNWQVKANCSNYSPVSTFTTLETPSSCPAPSGLTTTGITSNSALLAWSLVPNATSYTVQYKLTSSNTWTTAGTVSTANYNLTGLTASTSYDWKVKTNCSDYSSAVSFTTTATGCNAPVSLVTSNIAQTTATFSWGIVSGASSYTVQIKPANSNTWSTLTTTSSTSVNVSGLSAGTAYNWQVKANCSTYSAIVNFTTSTSGCNAPVNLVTSGITSNSAILTWGVVSGASTYTIQIKLASSNVWTTLTTIPGTTLTVNGLSAQSTYNWQVKANCSSYSSIATFTTTSAPGGCVPPTGLYNDYVTFNSAQCYWASVPGATSYTLIYRVSTSSTWTIVNGITTNTHGLYNLLAGKTYIWHVKANCAANFSSPASFATPSSSPEGLINTEVYKLFPNPVKDQLHLVIENADEIKNGSFEVISSSGAVIRRGILDSNDTLIETSDLSSGLYILRIIKEGSDSQVLKFVKAD